MDKVRLCACTYSILPNNFYTANVLQIAIMRKEFLLIETDSTESRNRLIAHFKDCIEFSGSRTFRAILVLGFERLTSNIFAQYRHRPSNRLRPFLHWTIYLGCKLTSPVALHP